MKRLFAICTLVVVAFLAGTRLAKGKPQQDIAVPFSCAVPKSYGDFKGMSGRAFVFENSSTGTIKVLTCESERWKPELQITRSNN